MNLGYDRTLYLLPFDHRRSFVADLFGFDLSLSAPQRRLRDWVDIFEAGRESRPAAAA